jgi:signal transduction histidine kinase
VIEVTAMSELTTSVPAPGDRLSAAQLRELFLFTELDDEQLAWISANGDVIEVPMGEEVVTEGAAATCFYVLLSGSIAMSRLIGGDRVETGRTGQQGVYFGAVQFYLDDDTTRTYGMTVRALTDCVLLALPAREFAAEFARWFPMAVHLLEGLLMGMRRGNALLGERERLLALGKLSAGLTHELNNPAAAAGRATVALRDRVEGMRHKLSMIASGKLAGAQLKKLVLAQEEFVKKVRHATPLSPLEASDREDELGDWLDGHEITGGWELAPIFVAGGLDVGDLDAVATATDEDTLEGAIRWLAYTVETESLLREITDATTRISDLVLAAKQYSQMDRAPYRWVDLHEGLDATLVMFGRKLEGEKGVRIVKDYDRTLPDIPAYPAELNQVWTNIIDNALDAMGGSGTLTVRTCRVEDRAIVEIADTGPGIPADIRQRIFEPFFTTKAVGHGTGLGLDVSYRVVVSRHHGDIRVESQPGATTFQVRLPLTEAEA